MLFGSRLNKLSAAIKRAIAALSGYAVASKEPELVFDFAQDYYRTSGSDTTFSDAITHARSSNATMVDSDGLLKWGPHNLLGSNSEDLTSGWTNIVGRWSITAAQDTYDGISLSKLETTSTDQHVITTAVSFTEGQKWTFSVIIKDINAGWVTINTSGFDVLNPTATFDLTSPAVSSSSFDTASIEDLGDGYRLLTVTYTATSDGNGVVRICSASSGSALNPSAAGESFYAGGCRVYRSDLGGMVNNPDRGDSYVPTTSSARYLARRGHHVYNGDSWVDKGVLVESEARTNLVTYSEDFTDASWTKSGGSVSGTTFTASSTTARIWQDVTVASGVPHTAWYVVSNPITDSFVVLRAVGFDTQPAAWFNLVTGTVGTVQSGLTAHMVEIEPDKYLCGVTFTTTTDVTGNFSLYTASSDSAFGTTIGASVDIHRAQLEAASTPSSYIPTSGSTVTRASDTLTVPSANLPWPSPVVIGEELVTNGTFDDASWWGTDASWTIADGVATVTGNDQLYSPTSWVPTAVPVLIQFDVTQVDTAGNLIVVATNPSQQSVSISATGTYTAIAYFNTADRLRFGSGSGSTFRGSIDNISVKEINPLSVSIQMDGEMTYADEDATPQHATVRWHLDNSTSIRHEFYTNSINTGQFRFTQVASSVTDTVADLANTYSPGLNVPFNIASRHGSTFVNGAVDGVALTADTTPTALPDLSATDLNLAYDYMGTVKTFRLWADDLGDAGIEEASEPSTVPSLSLTFDGASTSFTDTGMTV